VDRFERVREHIDVAGGRGLEIGPLTSPIVTRDLGDVRYVDHLSTDDLRTKYAPDPLVDEDAIVPIDFVWGSRTLAEAVGPAAPFDYVVASHVLEHVPDLVGWLEEVSEVLRPGGRLSVALPDRRYTFDVRRRDTDVSEVVEAYLLGLRRPAVRATFDHFYRHVPVDAGAIWSGLRGHDDPPPDAETAIAFALSAANTDAYVDTHCWVFSDAAFLDLIATLIRLDLVHLRVVAFRPTQPWDFEFFVTLERVGDDLSPAERRALCLASIPTIAAAAPADSNGAAAVSDPAMVLSEKELTLIGAKRWLMARVRGALATAGRSAAAARRTMPRRGSASAGRRRRPGC
jgi:SAM-dependent methyltransferase